MKRSRQPLFLCLTLLCLALAGVDARSQQDPSTGQVEPAAPAASEPVERADDESSRGGVRLRPRAYRDDEHVIFSFGEDANLPAGESADAVIAFMGNARVAGTVVETAVAVFGNVHVTGTAGAGAFSVFGDAYIDGPVGEGVGAIFGNLVLGPNAEIDGDVVVIGGRIERDPGAIVHGGSHVMSTGFVNMHWLQAWIEKCLLYGRPLAFEAELSWAWGIALGFLLFYVVIALLFDRSVSKCVETLEQQPGQSVVVSLMTVLLVPVLMMLLLISVIGIAVMPLVGLGLFCAGLFGKAVVLAALGRRLTRFTGIAPFSHVAFATLVGGIIVLGLYVIPAMGFIAYKLLGILGLGVVTYTLLLAVRQGQAARNSALRAAPIAAGPTAVQPTETLSSEAKSEPEAAAPIGAAPAVALPRAGFWIRMGALLVDVVLVGVILSILEPPGELLLLALAAYGAMMWKLKGTTIGGIVCGLKVVRRDGAEISWDTAIVRALGCFLSLIVAGLGFLWIVFDEDRQAWHDKIAGTLVVRSPKAEPLV